MGGNITPSCFLRGTRIRTPIGEVRVEELAVGQHVVTASGAAHPVKWVGHRAYDPRFIRKHPEVYPFLVSRDAIADGVPHRDLYLSRGHGLYLDGLLMQVEMLANGMSIRQMLRWVQPLDYFHVELDSHDAIFAEGVPAESFNDCGNRNQFQNADEFWRLYPDHRPAQEPDRISRAMPGPRLDGMRDHLHQRALAGQPAAPLSTKISSLR